MESYSTSSQNIQLHHLGSYVVGQYTDPRLDMAKESAFKVDRTLRDITKSNSLRITFQNKLILIKTSTESETKTLLSTTTFANHDASFTLHRTLNTTRATIRTNPLDSTLEAAGEELAPQGVSSIRRLSITHHYTILLLTFNSMILPPHVTLQNCRYTTRLHTSLPLRCKRCLRYGHGERACTSRTERCARCGEGHPSAGCSRPFRCAACDGSHPVTDPECPKWLFEREVTRYAANLHLPTAFARTMVTKAPPVHLADSIQHITPGRRTYASVASSTPTQARPQPQNPPITTTAPRCRRPALLPTPPHPPRWTPTREALLPTPPFPPFPRPQNPNRPYPPRWIPTREALLPTPLFPPFPRPTQRWRVPGSQPAPPYSCRDFPRLPPPPRPLQPSYPPKPHHKQTRTTATSTDPQPATQTVSTSTDPPPAFLSVHTQTDPDPYIHSEPNSSTYTTPINPSARPSPPKPQSGPSSNTRIPRPASPHNPKYIRSRSLSAAQRNLNSTHPASPSPMLTRGARRKRKEKHLADQSNPTPVSHYVSDTLQTNRAGPSK